VRTKDPGFTERVRTHAVLVPVIVLRKGEFVRGLTRQDFQIYEDGAPQSIASMGSENIPLELILAVDISGSMEHALDEVKPAVKRLLSRLRPGDAATLVGFNDTTFIAAEREKDPRTRENAVDLLSAWGGTALYDATVRVLDLVSREWGRRGVVLFSDGDDTASRASREVALSHVQASDAMLYTIGFDRGASVPRLRASLEQYARETGGRAFFPRDAAELDRAFDQIVAELANQYVLSYSPSNPEQDAKWRDITVKVRNCKCDVRARRGYRLDESRRAGR
jgi:Ca-activated chloride channel homolog